MFQEHGVELPVAIWGDTIGRASGSFDPLPLLEERIGQRLDRQVIRAQRHARHRRLVEQQMLLPGVEQYIQRAQELGLSLAVASSGKREWVEGNLERLGIRAHWACIHCCEDVAEAKPDPALYLLACRSLGVRPGEAIALEDSANGVLAAKRAGLFCVAVPNPLTEHLDLSLADIRVSSLADVPLDALIAMAEGRINIPS